MMSDARACVGARPRSLAVTGVGLQAGAQHSVHSGANSSRCQLPGISYATSMDLSLGQT